VVNTCIVPHSPPFAAVRCRAPVPGHYGTEHESLTVSDSEDSFGNGMQNADDHDDKRLSITPHHYTAKSGSSPDVLP